MHVAPIKVFRVSQPASILFTDLVSLQKMLGTGQSFDRIELSVPPARSSKVGSNKLKPCYSNARGGSWTRSRLLNHERR